MKKTPINRLTNPDEAKLGSIIDFQKRYSEDFIDGFDECDAKILKSMPNKRRRTPIMVEFADTQIRTVDLQRTMEAGMNIAKFKMADSTTSEKAIMLETAEKASQRCVEKSDISNCIMSTCATLKTWVIKTGLIDEPEKGGYITIEKDSEVIMTSDKNMMSLCSREQIFIGYSNLGTDLKIGMEMATDQSEILFKCIGIIDKNTIKCVVTKGGQLKNLQTVFIRNFKHTTPFITATDIQIFKFCIEYQIDMVLVYYVEEDSVIHEIKKYFRNIKYRPLIYSAICNQRGLDNFDKILKASDGILFARDFLVYELDVSKTLSIPRLQKWAAGKCLQVGKPMFISGGVFRQVISRGKLTNREIADVTNAIKDGVTGFMLKECANIKNTIIALESLNDICCTVEPLLEFDSAEFWRIMQELKMPVNAGEAAAISCVAAANYTKAKVIIIPTVTGHTAQTLLWLQPSCIVITVSTSKHVARLLNTCRNIVPLIYRAGATNKIFFKEMDERIRFAVHYAVSKSWLEYEDFYIALQRSTDYYPYCDMVRILTVEINKIAILECSEKEGEKNPYHVASIEKENHVKVNKENRNPKKVHRKEHIEETRISAEKDPFKEIKENP